MKKLLTLIAVAAMCAAASAQKAQSLEVSFNYQRQDTHGSNQFAVWIENDKGEVVRTLFVTAFTTKGRARGNEELVRGYVKRPYCVPTWVKDVNANSLSDSDLDAYTGATPKESGIQSFTWDLKDSKGAVVANGNYKVFVEATLFDSSIVTYSGSFSTANTGAVALQRSLTTNEGNREAMISDVKAVVK